MKNQLEMNLLSNAKESEKVLHNQYIVSSTDSLEQLILEMLQRGAMECHEANLAINQK